MRSAASAILQADGGIDSHQIFRSPDPREAQPTWASCREAAFLAVDELLSHRREIGGKCGSALLALGPELSKPSNILSVELPVRLPISNRLAHDLAGRGILSGLYGVLRV